MGNTSGQAVSGTTQNIEYAGFWVRVAAYFVDFAIVTGICLVIAVGASFVGAVWIAMLVLPLIQFLYWPVMESSARQATFGKSLCGIKVTDLEGRHLSFKSALLRNIAKILSAIPFCIGFLLAAFTARKQALHDMLAKSLVIRTGPNYVFRTIAVAVGGFIVVVACGAAYFYYVYMPQMAKDITGAMQDATKNAPTVRVPPLVTKKVEQSTSAIPVTPPVTAEPAPFAIPKTEQADPDFDNLLGPALTGLEKPGTTRAGPAILELSTFLGDSVWIKLHLPLIKDIDIAPSPEITINSVLDESGKNFYDSASSFETEFFRRAGLGHVSSPVPHLSGLRTVRIKPGLNKQTLQKIEGQVRIAIPVDIKTITFDVSEVGKEKSVHGRTITLKSLLGAKAVLHYQSTSENIKKMSGGVRGYDKDGALVKIEKRQGGLSGTQIDFKGPVSKVEVLSATDVVERQFPFTLVRGAVAGSPLPVAEVAKPSALAPSATASAADEPEAIYAKFHSAGLTANFDEMLKYGTAQPDLISMPAAERQAMLDFLAQMLPKTYTVMRKMVDPDGNHATLHLDASGVVGTITLVKENGMWKVGNADWGGSPKTSELPSNMKAATVTGTKVKPPPVKETKGQLSTAASEEPPVAPERTYQVSPENVITPKFNDVMTAVLRQDQAAVTQLLDLGWWVDKPNSSGFTPLMEAVAMGDAPMAELLLKRGANPNAAARDGSVLQIAKRNRDAAMAELLRRYGAAGE